MIKSVLIVLCALSVLSSAQELKCITCSGVKDSDCASKLDAFKVDTACTKAGDSCYAYVNGAGAVNRGCFGEQNFLTECSGASCEQCNTENYCNSKIFELSTSAPTAGTTTMGTTQAPSGGSTTQAPSGGPTTQAPSGGATTQAPSGGSTTQAPSGGATTQAPAADGTVNCYECNSQMDIKCLKEADTLTPSACSNSICYTISWNNFYVRGCLANALPEVKLICDNTKQTQCITCKTDKCNKEVVNSAKMHTFATGLLTFALILALKNL